MLNLKTKVQLFNSYCLLKKKKKKSFLLIASFLRLAFKGIGFPKKAARLKKKNLWKKIILKKKSLTSGTFTKSY